MMNLENALLMKLVERTNDSRGLQNVHSVGHSSVMERTRHCGI